MLKGGSKELIEATKNRNITLIKQLVENGANVNAFDDAALQWAAQNGHLDIVTYLVEHSANIHTCDDLP